MIESVPNRSPASATAICRTQLLSYPWIVVGLFWLVFFLNQADRQVIFSVFPLVKTELALSDGQLGAIGSMFFWVYALLVPIAGSLGDTFSRKLIVIGALLLWSTATFVSGFAASLLMLLVLRALTAGGEAFYYPAAASLISDLHGERTRATALSVHQTANYFGVMVSGGLAGFIGQQYGWRTAFLVFGSAGFLVALVLMTALRDPARATRQQDRSSPYTVLQRFRIVVSTPSVLLHTLAFLAMLVTLTAYLAWMPTLLFRKFGMDLASAGFHATFWHHLGAMAGTLFGGRLSDRLASHAVISRPVLQAAGLFLGAPFVLMAGGLNTAWMVFGALGLFGFFRGIYDSNLFASPYAVVPTAVRSTATGVILAVGFCGGGIGPLLAGQLSQQFDLGFAVAFMSVFYLLGSMLLSVDAAFFFRPAAQRMAA